MTVEQHQRSGGMEVLTPVQGLAAGIGSASVMAVVMMLGSSLAGTGFWTPINAIGSFFQGGPLRLEFAGSVTLLGVAIHLLVGGLLGVLYASAQELIDLPSLLIVAVYYGLVTWFVSTFAVLSWLRPGIHEVWKAWPVFIGHLSFGFLLGLTAAYSIRRREPEIFSPD